MEGIKLVVSYNSMRGCKCLYDFIDVDTRSVQKCSAVQDEQEQVFTPLVPDSAFDCENKTELELFHVNRVVLAYLETYPELRNSTQACIDAIRLKYPVFKAETIARCKRLIQNTQHLFEADEEVKTAQENKRENIKQSEVLKND